MRNINNVTQSVRTIKINPEKENEYRSVSQAN